MNEKNIIKELVCPNCFSGDYVKFFSRNNNEDFYKCHKCKGVGTIKNFKRLTKLKDSEMDSYTIGKLKQAEEQIRSDIEKYGTIYFPYDIKESVNDLAGLEDVKESLDDFFYSFKNFSEIAVDLAKVNLFPSFTYLFYGLSGSGKTSIARAYAKKYQLPICIVDSSKIVNSLLGSTLKNISNVMDIASDIAKEHNGFILFFDEIDAIGSERSAKGDIGEIKRAVISFLQALDKVYYAGVPLIVFGATNHEHLLDVALWRRFNFHKEFSYPDYKLRKEIFELYLEKIEEISRIRQSFVIDNSIRENLTKELGKIEKKLKTIKYLEEFEGSDFWKKMNFRKKGLLEYSHGYSGSDIQRAFKVALFRSIRNNKLGFTTLLDSVKAVGGILDKERKYYNK